MMTTARDQSRVRAAPFRANHVGSLLRPDMLKRAREQHLGADTAVSNLGPHDSAALREVEDACIRDVIAMQERAGLAVVTDGEFRRRSWWLELIMNWEGFAADRTGSNSLAWRNDQGATEAFTELKVTAPVRWRPSAIVRAFEFVNAHARVSSKVTLPAPNVAHYFTGGPKNLDRVAYADFDAFWDDLVAAYRQEVGALIAAGASFIQFDDSSIAFLCDPAHRDYVRAWGADPDELLRTDGRKLNAVLEVVPDGVTTAMHQCRGNREGSWAAEGGYDPVAEVLFNEFAVDGFFLEYDSERAGGFEPLRFLPPDKFAVLGLVSSKHPRLEPADTLVRRIEEASAYADFEQLALSPQCGFASWVKGNPLTEDAQRAKLERIVDVAHRVWGQA